ncbi:hypothetical protein HZA97_07905 [Candidatus Woesearchaeota archaeon]|nr:hypothetical protein [Candidatus Woesearchaeota archaeon]
MGINPELKSHLAHLGNLGIFTAYRSMPFFHLLKYTGFTNFTEQRGCMSVKNKSSKTDDLIDWLEIVLNDNVLRFDEWGQILECKLTDEDQKELIVVLKGFEEYLVHSLFRTYFFKSTVGVDAPLEDYLNMNVCPIVVEFYNFIESDFKKIEPLLKEAKITVEKLKFFKSEYNIEVELGKDFLKLSAKNSFIKIPLVKFERHYFTQTYKARGDILYSYVKFRDQWMNVPEPSKFTLDPLNTGISAIYFSEYYDKKVRETESGKESMEEIDKSFPLKQKISLVEYQGDQKICARLAGRLLCSLGSYMAKNGKNLLVL